MMVSRDGSIMAYNMVEIKEMDAIERRVRKNTFELRGRRGASVARVTHVLISTQTGHY